MKEEEVGCVYCGACKEPKKPIITGARIECVICGASAPIEIWRDPPTFMNRCRLAEQELDRLKHLLRELAGEILARPIEAKWGLDLFTAHGIEPESS